jgi:hypothetical protein
MWGFGDVDPLLLTFALVGGELSALPPWKERPVSIEEEAGWAAKPAWTPYRRDKSLSPARIRNPAVQPIPHRYTD